MKRINNEQLLKLIGEIDGIHLSRSGNSSTKVTIELGGKDIEVICDGHSNIDHHITRIGICEAIAKKFPT